jgi:hypothetical protein
VLFTLDIEGNQMNSKVDETCRYRKLERKKALRETKAQVAGYY